MSDEGKKKYSLGNSASPMIFRKKKPKDKKLTRSLDDLISSVDKEDSEEVGVVEWPELASVKKVGPVVMCLVPPFSADFVCSALLSVGATPLITDSEDCRLVLICSSLLVLICSSLLGKCVRACETAS